jgi:hypothetical protein
MPKPTQGPTQEELYEALVESVKLQSHYASLLNRYDGGERMTFAGPHDWIQRLRDLKGVQ